MNANAIKRQVAKIFDVIGINSLGHFFQRSALFPFVRAVNYHEVPAGFAENFETQLKFYSSRFVDVTYRDLSDFLQSGKWPHDKPGLILSFDDGLRSHYETAAPLLEKYGFTGWFFVPAGWVSEQNGGQVENPEYPAGVATLTREQLLYLDKHHVVGCHTETHCRLSEDLPPEKMRRETLEAQKTLEELLGHPVKIFCWVGGEEYTYSKPAADLIRQGYELGFMTNTAIVRPGTNPLQLQRINIEAENPLSLVRFQLSGLMDIAYYPKRKRVNALTG
jgi:peptidoglycan/xylan/chitin deacetylase (PgdA/CDA1 family)